MAGRIDHGESDGLWCEWDRGWFFFLLAWFGPARSPSSAPEMLTCCSAFDHTTSPPQPQHVVVSTQSKCSIYKRPTTTLCSLMISRQRQPAKDCTKDHSLPSPFSLFPSPFSLLTSPSHLFFFFFFFYFFFSFPFFFGKKVGIMIAFNILIVPTHARTGGRTDGRADARTTYIHWVRHNTIQALGKPLLLTEGPLLAKRCVGYR